MSDRKYRQHGYQDDDRDRRPRSDGPPGGDRRPEREPGAPAGTRRMSSEGAKNPRMMGYRQVAKCARCGAPVEAEILTLSKCEKCGTNLHACVQCVNFDPSARFECSRADPGPHLAQGRRQHLRALHRAHQLRARDQLHTGAGGGDRHHERLARVGLEREESVRRSLQLLGAGG